MIDVSTLAGPCPRCPGRRVWRVSVPTDEWSYIDNARPFPSERSHVRDHSPLDISDDPASAMKVIAAAQLRNQVR